MPERMHGDEIEVDEALVRHLLATQFPDLAEEQLTIVEPWGTDNAIWRLGSDLVLRFPRIHWATEQVEFEAMWLPRLAPHLPVAVPEPIAVGRPGGGYPYRWAVHRWLPGDSATLDQMDDPVDFAHRLADVVKALWSIPVAGAPEARNRARPLAQYNDSALGAIVYAGDLIDAAQARAVWDEALAAPPHAGDPVWVHGDIEGNCLLHEGRLSGIVDWGAACAGDPAVDIQVVWSPLFTAESRRLFLEDLDVDDATLARSRGAAIQQACSALPYCLVPGHTGHLTETMSRDMVDTGRRCPTMESARYLVRSVVFEKRSVRAVAAQHEVSKTWLYELVARYKADGDEALEPRSKRPKSSPGRISAVLEDEIVQLRKALAEEGFDAGAVTIQAHLERRHGKAPAVSSIWRVLNRRGFVNPQPQKRPKSSYVRFEADLPNERWQMDMTHVELARGKVVEVLNIIDDHSRLCVASRAFSVVTAPDVVAVFAQAAERFGLPASMLSDNGAIFTAAYRKGHCITEIVLEAHGVTFTHSRPYHPQTCGKIERFHQTEKKFLYAKRKARSLPELQERLDTFTTYYNDVRPHRAKGRRTPAEAYGARLKASPKGTPAAPYLHYRIRKDKVDAHGKITLRYEGKLRHLGVGHAHNAERVLVLVADRDVRVLSATTAELLGHYLIDPAKNYQAKLPV